MEELKQMSIKNKTWSGFTSAADLRIALTRALRTQAKLPKGKGKPTTASRNRLENFVHADGELVLEGMTNTYEGHVAAYRLLNSVRKLTGAQATQATAMGKASNRRKKVKSGDTYRARDGANNPSGDHAPFRQSVKETAKAKPAKAKAKPAKASKPAKPESETGKTYVYTIEMPKGHSPKIVKFRSSLPQDAPEIQALVQVRDAWKEASKPAKPGKGLTITATL
jgi:hypothetical protein